MTDKKKPIARKDLDDAPKEVSDLPPIVDDEVHADDPALYAQYLDETLDEPACEPKEAEGSDLEMEVAEDLIEIQEGLFRDIGDLTGYLFSTALGIANL